jgi:hypothetical protein
MEVQELLLTRGNVPHGHRFFSFHTHLPLEFLPQNSSAVDVPTPRAPTTVGVQLKGDRANLDEVARHEARRWLGGHHRVTAMSPRAEGVAPHPISDQSPDQPRMARAGVRRGVMAVHAASNQPWRPPAKRACFA